MATTPRDRARAQTMNDIVRIGRDHLATHGAAALSLRAVARDLGVVSSAVYRYVSSRDELLTLLVVDGYTALGDAVDEALRAAEAADDDPIAQIRALAHAFRRWALAEPARFGLLYGTPVPGYAAPAERTGGPGTRVIGTLLTLFARGEQAGKLAAPRRARALSATLAADIARIREESGAEASDRVLVGAMTFLVSMIGAVSADVFDMYGVDTFTDRGELFEHLLDDMLETVGAEPR
ncbi:TetR/AcrR family transcriptional regulator [Nocardia callitridis]|uniref:TetR/AcrR family transcriptional regulator n=1 Tax=Nocardia callitridis TaxID=648753 RepID=A0ABP9K621_9NOCA